MACNEGIRPKCGVVSPPAIEEEKKFDQVNAIGNVLVIAIVAFVIIILVLSIITFLVQAAITTAGVATGVIAAAVAAIVILIIVTNKFNEICGSGPKGGTTECVAGVVSNIKNSFSELSEDVFPFTINPSRIDVVVKSDYWSIVERNATNVYCTNDDWPRKSEIMRCYFKDAEACNALTGAVVGTMTGLVAGMAAAGVAAAAIGCATFFFCLIGIIVGAILGILAAVLGAFVGGQVGKATGTAEVDEIRSQIVIGDLITVQGNMLRREAEGGANVLWYVNLVSELGVVPASISNNPFSYCEIDEILSMDACTL